MKHPKVDNDEMMKRVIRFSNVKKSPIPVMFIDSSLKGHQRLNYALIGDTAAENDEYSPMLNTPHTYQVGMVFALPGNGPAWHTHDYVESFMPLSGRWRFYWGNDENGEPEGNTVLDPWDLISLPPGLWRSFEVDKAETEGAWILGILDQHKVFEGKDPYWPEKVVKEAMQVGFYADEKGKMIKPENYEGIKKELLDKISPHMSS